MGLYTVHILGLSACIECLPFVSDCVRNLAHLATVLDVMGGLLAVIKVHWLQAILPTAVLVLIEPALLQHGRSNTKPSQLQSCLKYLLRSCAVTNLYKCCWLLCHCDATPLLHQQ